MRARSASSLLVLLCACGGAADSAPSAERRSSPEPPRDAAANAEAPDTESPRRGRSRAGERSVPGGEVTVVSTGEPGSQAPGRLVGVATFAGTPPERKPIGPIANTQGCSGHAETPLTESVVVEDGRLANLFVYVSDGVEDWRPGATPPEPVLLDQHGCLYVPHVVGAYVGQAVLARNSDSIAHNVHVIAKRNPSPNKTQGAGAQPLELAFERREVPVTFVCDIHPWMKAYLCVVEHPYFAVTGADGSFAIEGLPPGDYTLTTWHESLERHEVDVSVPAGGEVRVEFAFD